MRRYKLAIHILVILSVFNFLPVLAAPIPVRQVHEAYPDVMDEDWDIVSEKRAGEREDLWSGHYDSGSRLPTSQHPRGSPSTSDYASGVHQETTHPIQRPSSASRDLQGRDAGQTFAPGAPGGTELLWNSPGGYRRPQYASGGKEMAWNSPGGLRRPQYASGGTELKWYSPGGPQRPKYASGGTELPWNTHNGVKPGTSVRTKPGEPVPGIGPTSGGTGLPSSVRTKPPSAQEGYPAQTPKKPPAEPPSKGFLGGLASKSKSLLKVSNLKFWRRISQGVASNGSHGECSCDPYRCRVVPGWEYPIAEVSNAQDA